MSSDILNAENCGVTSGFGYGETNRVALRAVDDMRGASNGTIYISMGYEVGGVADLEISTAANGLGAARISQEGSALPLQSVGSNLFVMSAVQDNGSVGQVRFERFIFQRALRQAAA
jgi:hypothetical protein